MAELKIFEINMQEDIEIFFKKVFGDLGWGYEPQGRHCDTINISHEYMKNGCFWCLYDNNQLIGTVAIRTIDWQSKTAELKRLYVLQEERGKGYGDLLFRTAVKYAKETPYNTKEATRVHDSN